MTQTFGKARQKSSEDNKVKEYAEVNSVERKDEEKPVQTVKHVLEIVDQHIQIIDKHITTKDGLNQEKTSGRTSANIETR